MPIQTVCDSCSTKIKIKDELIGKAIKCPKCGARIAVHANGGGATESVNVAQGALPSDPLCKTDQVPSAQAQGPEITGELASGLPPADAAVAPAADFSATQDFASTADADPPATEFLSTPDAASAPAARPAARGAGAPESLGGYRIVRELGQGGMGAVYEAEDGTLKRHVALKIMKPEIAKNQQHRERFLREARNAAKVKSDFICPIYRVGEDDGVPFIAMPFLKGKPLDAHLKQALRLPVDDVVRIGREVAQGLKVAHEAGLVHRDIKPANIWLETQRSGPPRAMILDFGLARMQADDVHITQSGAIIGTPAFMSPEQARGDKNVDARTDLFSLGCVLYALCTGELPFKGDTTMGVLTALATHDPTPPHKISATTPKALSRLIMRLLAKRPDDRPQTAGEVIEELAAVDADHANPADGAFTTQVEAPLPPNTSADTSEPNTWGAGKATTRRRERQSVAAPSARMQTLSYVLFGLIGVGLLGCVAPLAGGGLYFIFFAGGNGADPKVAAEEGNAPDGKAPPEPTGEVPAGWVVVKRPVENYTVAMPHQPETRQGQNFGKAARLPNGTELATFSQPIVPAQIAQLGGPDATLDRQLGIMLAVAGGIQPGKVPPITKISLGQCKGREVRLTGRSPQGVATPLFVRMYLIGNLLVTLTGPAQGASPAPETAAFFNSLKLGADRSPPTILLKGMLTRDDPLDSFGLTKNSFHKVHLVPLESGKPYLIDMEGPFDTFLRIEDADKKTLLFNDDMWSPHSLNSRLVFTPPKKDTYRLIATSFDPRSTGSYTIGIREAAKVGDARVIKGRLEKMQPRNVHLIELVDGSPYTLELTSPNLDATIVLTGSPVQASATPSNPARLDFTPPSTQSFQAVVTSARPDQTGDYTLSIQRYEEATKAKGP